MIKKEDKFFDEDLSMSAIRAKRNKLLSETDYMMVSDYPIAESDKNKLIAYRRELRDLPSVVDIKNPTFPEKPI